MDICFTSDDSYSNEAMHGEGKLIHARLFSIRIPRFRDLSCNYASRDSEIRYGMLEDAA